MTQKNNAMKLKKRMISIDKKVELNDDVPKLQPLFDKLRSLVSPGKDYLVPDLYMFYPEMIQLLDEQVKTPKQLYHFSKQVAKFREDHISKKPEYDDVDDIDGLLNYLMYKMIENGTKKFFLHDDVGVNYGSREFEPSQAKPIDGVELTIDDEVLIRGEKTNVSVHYLEPVNIKNPYNFQFKDSRVIFEKSVSHLPLAISSDVFLHGDVMNNTYQHNKKRSQGTTYHMYDPGLFDRVQGMLGFRVSHHLEVGKDVNNTLILYEKEKPVKTIEVRSYNVNK